MLLVIPGPTILLVVSYALGQGWRTALPMAVGVALGDFTAMTLSMLGIGALLAASATVFTALKWIGAAYLIYLGIKLFRAGGALNAEPRTDARLGREDDGACLAGHGAQPEEHHLLRRLPAAVPRPPRRFLDADADLRGDLPGARLRQCLRLRAGRRAGAQRGRAIRSAIRIFNRTGGTLLVGAGIATVAMRSGN